MSEWTPNTTYVEDVYALNTGQKFKKSRHEFRRWLEAHDAEITIAEHERIIALLRQERWVRPDGEEYLPIERAIEFIEGENE